MTMKLQQLFIAAQQRNMRLVITRFDVQADRIRVDPAAMDQIQFLQLNGKGEIVTMHLAIGNLQITRRTFCGAGQFIAFNLKIVL